MRVLITGFGPFPRAPFNPSAAVAKALARRRRPALAGLVRTAHVFATRYADVDRDLPRLMAQQPDIVLMFGLAGRTRELRIERRARNAIAPLLPDAGKHRPQHRAIELGAPPARFGGAPFSRMAAAIRGRNVPARLSRDPGTYLCNYAYWRALVAARHGRPLVLFVHIPLVPIAARPRRRVRRRSLSLGQIVGAAESLLIALAAAATLTLPANRPSVSAWNRVVARRLMRHVLSRSPTMTLDRRRLFAAFACAAGTATAASPTLARSARQAEPPLSRESVINGTALGLRPNAPDDQSIALQRAIDTAAAARAVLHLPAGRYRAGNLKLPSYTTISGVAGATQMVLAAGTSLLTAAGGEHIRLSGLVLDGAAVPLPQHSGLIHFAQVRAMRIADCEIVNVGGNGIALEGAEGDVSGNTINAADAAIFSRDAQALKITGNHVRSAGNNGILVWRSAPGDDGTLVIDNRIENIGNKAGGSGQYGNAINVFRAANVIVRGNRIRNAAFSAVRGNAASNLQIVGNTCTGLGEVALYAEFGFEGALVANNIVDGAALGISVTNFKSGGRLAVVQGNLIRNVVGRRPVGTDPNDAAGIGIGIEADTVVNGNVIENAAHAGIAAGWGAYLRDVAINGNIVRGADYGITVSVAPGAGASVIADNLISGARRGAIVGMEWKKPVTGDLATEGAARYAQLSISGNGVR